MVLLEIGGICMLITGIIGASTAIYNVAKDDIHQYTDTTIDFFRKKLKFKLIINRERDYKCSFAILELLKNSDQTPSSLIVRDGFKFPEYELPDGTYKILYSHKTFNLKLYITLSEKQIIINGPSGSVEDLKQFMNSVYSKYCSPQNVVSIYNSTYKGWGQPIMCRPLNTDIKLTDNMKYALNYISDILEGKRKRDRCGAMFYGMPGTGKTTLIQILQAKHDMSIYQVHLNGNKMDDSSLSTLINSTPPCSLIVIEEVEKQLMAMKKNPTCNISNGGIIVSFDGPRRLSIGSFIIMTCNNLDLIEPEFRDQLLREGRLGEPFIFTQKFI